MTKDVQKSVQHCDKCQKGKVTGIKNYGKIPIPDDKVVDPWDTVHVDLLGQWKIKFYHTGTKRTVVREIKAFSAIDYATGWPEATAISNKRSYNTATIFDNIWLCRYPRPRRVIFDNGGEFVGAEFQELLDSYGITKVPITNKNPRANSPVERLHL